jgi:hypothetical protein
MSNPTHLRRAAARAAIVVGLAALVAPTAAHAATPVNLGTANAFVVLGGSTVTNTGSSVLNGDLGVSPGTALPGFGPATINGATHANDAVAAQAQLDLTTAYNVAAGQTPATDKSGQNLGGQHLAAGAYAFSSDAQLTFTLTLDAGGNPNAQFVIMIASALTTASNSSVVLTGLASPCNVYWQVGSSATLGTTTAFQGNLMALTSIAAQNGATVNGRLLARNGAVTLDNNVLSRGLCSPTTSGPVAPPGDDSGSGDQAPPGGGTTTGSDGTSTWTRTPPSSGPACQAGFRATVRGRQIANVVFRLDGRRIASRTKSPFRVSVKAGAGNHWVTARVTFKDATRAKTMRLRYRVCAAAALRPRQGPSRFTG